MEAAGGGRIVHIGLDVVDRSLSTMPADVAAKAAQVGLAETSARHPRPVEDHRQHRRAGLVPVERHADVGQAERDA